MPAKSVNKGKAAERALCKTLGSIFGGSFIRADSSGAFIGGVNAHRKANLSEGQIRARKSDIIPPDFLLRLVCESKFYEDFPWHALLTPGPIPQLDEWIEQTMTSSDSDDFWVVCFKINYRGSYVCLPYRYDLPAYDLTNYSIYHGAHGRFIVTELEDFFRRNEQLIRRLAGVRHSNAA